MSDHCVAEALRSDARLVVVKAPAGCGKTHQAADYASWLAIRGLRGQLLILTHTHAACDVFRERTASIRRVVQVLTLDALVVQVASMYHLALGLPTDTAAWAHEQGERGFERLAEMVGALLASSPAVASALVARYPVIVCDEHQDANAAQHVFVMELFKAGAALRILADPMQAIYARGAERQAQNQRWDALTAQADRVEDLNTPHRWADGAPTLGAWVLAARTTLKNGGAIDLGAPRPEGLTILCANNVAPRHGGFQLDPAAPLRRLIRDTDPVMILTARNSTARGLRAFLGRTVPIWEGHTRDALHALVRRCVAAQRDPRAVADALRRFLQAVAIGFTDSNFANRLLAEVESGATRPSSGKPAKLQLLARCIVDGPDHRGVARALEQLLQFVDAEPGFGDIKFDLAREVHEAVRLGGFEDVIEGLAELTRRRSMAPARMPTRFISTVHKAKGLQGPHAILVPCDREHFPDTPEKRCLLYVALSRASHTLTIVTSLANPSPLFVGAY